MAQKAHKIHKAPKTLTPDADAEQQRKAAEAVDWYRQEQRSFAKRAGLPPEDAQAAIALDTIGVFLARQPVIERINRSAVLEHLVTPQGEVLAISPPLLALLRRQKVAHLWEMINTACVPTGADFLRLQQGFNALVGSYPEKELPNVLLPVDTTETADAPEWFRGRFLAGITAIFSKELKAREVTITPERRIDSDDEFREAERAFHAWTLAWWSTDDGKEAKRLLALDKSAQPLIIESLTQHITPPHLEPLESPIQEALPGALAAVERLGSTDEVKSVIRLARAQLKALRAAKAKAVRAEARAARSEARAQREAKAKAVRAEARAAWAARPKKRVQLASRKVGRVLYALEKLQNCGNPACTKCPGQGHPAVWRAYWTEDGNRIKWWLGHREPFFIPEADLAAYYVANARGLHTSTALRKALEADRRAAPEEQLAILKRLEPLVREVNAMAFGHDVDVDEVTPAG